MIVALHCRRDGVQHAGRVSVCRRETEVDGDGYGDPGRGASRPRLNDYARHTRSEGPSYRVRPRRGRASRRARLYASTSGDARRRDGARRDSGLRQVRVSSAETGAASGPPTEGIIVTATMTAPVSTSAVTAEGAVRLTSVTTAPTVAPLHLESKCMPSPGGQINRMAAVPAAGSVGGVAARPPGPDNHEKCR